VESTTENIILGIDPGTVVMGYGLIQVQSDHTRLIEMGVLKLSKYKDPYERLQHIHEKVAVIIRQYHPHYFAIEAPFYGKNVQSMLKLGRAQGVAIATAMQAGVPVSEYSPKKIKQAVTGNGNAAKEQVWQMLQRILLFEEKPAYFDATDALAVALCHHFQSRHLSLSNGVKSAGWKDYIVQHPEKVIVRRVPK
jgi:crossover junction endodeoxyribonuclease RuvC